MSKPTPDNPRDDAKKTDPRDPGESLGHYELADHPDEMDQGPPPAAPSIPAHSTKPTPAQDAGPQQTDGGKPPAPDAPTAGEGKAPSTAPEAPSRCPECKKLITGKLLAGNCPHCGKRIADPAAGVEQSAKHANAALALGVLSIPLGLISIALLNPIFGSVLGAVLGGVAVHFARQAKQEIAEGYAPATSEGAANLGHLCGIIGVVLGCALTLFYAALQLIAFALEF